MRVIAPSDTGGECTIVETTADRLTQEQAAQWEELDSSSTAAELFSSIEHARAVAVTDGAPQLFYLAYRGGALVGGVNADLMPEAVAARYSVQQILEGSEVVPGLGRWESAERLMPSLTMTTRSCRACDVRLGRSLGAHERAAAAEALVGAAVATAEGSARSVCALFVPADAEPVTEALARQGFHRARIGAQPFLRVAFDGFDGYLATLSGDRRRKVRRERRALREHGGLTLRVRELRDGFEEHVRLARFNVEKYGNGFDAESYGARRGWLLKDDGAVRALVVELLDRSSVRGSLVCVGYRGQLVLRDVGIDPSLPKAVFPYFNLMYRAIELAVELEATVVVAGPDQVATKLSRLGELECHDLWLRTSSPALRERLRQLDSAGRAMVAGFRRAAGVAPRETASGA